jgi:hypothetical protein
VPLWKRAETLHKVANLLRQHKDAMAECLIKEVAKPAKDSIAEVCVCSFIWVLWSLYVCVCKCILMLSMCTHIRIQAYNRKHLWSHKLWASVDSYPCWFLWAYRETQFVFAPANRRNDNSLNFDTG